MTYRQRSETGVYRSKMNPVLKKNFAVEAQGIGVTNLNLVPG